MSNCVDALRVGSRVLDVSFCNVTNFVDGNRKRGNDTCGKSNSLRLDFIHLAVICDESWVR